MRRYIIPLSGLVVCLELLYWEATHRDMIPQLSDGIKITMLIMTLLGMGVFVFGIAKPLWNDSWKYWEKRLRGATK